MTREEVLERIAEACKHKKEVHLSGVNLSGLDLSFVNLRRANLERALLHGVNLEGANLQGANLSGADICETNLMAANLERCDLRAAYLTGSILRGAWLYEADMRYTEIIAADLTEADLTRTNLTRACLHRSNFGGANLHGANLRNADLTGADLRGTNMLGATLTGACLKGAKLSMAAFPLWCGGLRIHVDESQLQQLLYHVLSLAEYSNCVSNETKSMLLTKENVEYANKCYMVGMCPELHEMGHDHIPTTIQVGDLADKIEQMKDENLSHEQIVMLLNSHYGLQPYEPLIEFLDIEVFPDKFIMYLRVGDENRRIVRPWPFNEGVVYEIIESVVKDDESGETGVRDQPNE